MDLTTKNEKEQPVDAQASKETKGSPAAEKLVDVPEVKMPSTKRKESPLVSAEKKAGHSESSQSSAGNDTKSQEKGDKNRKDGKNFRKPVSFVNPANRIQQTQYIDDTEVVVARTSTSPVVVKAPFASEVTKKKTFRDPDYKDPQGLRRFIGELGRINRRSAPGATPSYQKKAARAIKRARFLALIPYVKSD